ncbi:CDP-glucose 4,6-dehydratase [Cyanobium sp. PCC 7001]|uniref:CDP-glucose 4,6-dehydratase n=1 Tax=Cyanobium sp. PCC 7001 TaxID=180281 RepID=UPI000180599F|nr:CDP-glucose 4,6-dehydratase [Cyanobium sp. PCC 7001]EDY39127.1 CDP-glucose 4,6-dehydratase [Cyanobium sp. PCC 7001]
MTDPLGIDPGFWAGRRVLLTGHTGFKGAWLSLWLLQLGAQVHGLALPPEGDESLYKSLALEERFPRRLISRLVDVRDAAAVGAAVQAAQPEVVLHLAAQALVRRGYADPVGTWATNTIGSLHLLEALKHLQHPCAVVMVTTDKVYENREWVHGYRETDRLGGHDPYSASKAGAELAIASWRRSFCGHGPHQVSQLAIATARAGNVIGGGDWADHRVVPDAMRACAASTALPLRSPEATRPWQHVLEPLGGYLMLAEALHRDPDTFAEAWNFGPALESNRRVAELVDALHRHWPGHWVDASDPAHPHEAGLLHLAIDKAVGRLGWHPRWGFAATVARTACWYRQVYEGASPLACCQADLEAYRAG